MICGSLPILPQFVRQIGPRLTSIFMSNSQRKSTTQATPSNRIYHSGSANGPKRAGSGAWHDLRDMRSPNAPYVEFDRSDTAALAPKAAVTAESQSTEGDATTPPGKGGGEVWDGPVVRQTDLESGASVSDWHSKRSLH